MYQKIIIVGNLGGDPQMRYMQDGTAVTNFSVATNRRWTDRATGQPVDETTWFRVDVWGRQAETANQYLTSGQKCLVEGRLTPDPKTGSPRLWTRKSDNSVGATFELRADTVRFLGSNDEILGEMRGDPNGQSTASPKAAQEEDDIPF